MTFLSSSNLNQIAALYEDIAISEQDDKIFQEVENWVNSLLEEGYDLSEYTWEEMYESYLEEAPARNYGNPDLARYNQAAAQSNKDRATRSTAQRQVQTALGQGRGIDVRGATTGAAQGRGFGAVSGGRQGIVVNRPLKPGETQQINVAGRTLFPAKSGNRTVYLPSKDAKPATPLFKSSTKPDRDPTPDPTPDRDLRRNRNIPATTPAVPKVAPTKPASATSSSATASTADKIAGGMKVYDAQRKSGDMKGAAETGMNISKMKYGDQLKPKTPNPLMQKTFGYQTGNSPKEQQARADKIVQSGAVQALAPKPAAKVTPAATSTRNGFGVSSAPIAASSSVKNVTAPEVKAANTIAAKPKLPSLAPTRAPIRQMQTQSYEYDTYDVVLEYLLSQGHAGTIEEAHYVMMEMDADMIQNILDEDRAADNDKKYNRARQRAAQRAAERNAARARGQTGSVPGVGYVSPRREGETYRDSAGTERHHSGARAR